MGINKGIPHVPGPNSKSNKATEITAQSIAASKNGQNFPNLTSLIFPTEHKQVWGFKLHNHIQAHKHRNLWWENNNNKHSNLQSSQGGGITKVDYGMSHWQHTVKVQCSKPDEKTMYLHCPAVAKLWHITMWCQDTQKNQHDWQQSEMGSMQHGHCWRNKQSTNTFLTQPKWQQVIRNNNDWGFNQLSPNQTPPAGNHVKRSRRHVPHQVKQGKPISHDILWDWLECNFGGIHEKPNIWSN